MTASIEPTGAKMNDRLFSNPSRKRLLAMLAGILILAAVVYGWTFPPRSASASFFSTANESVHLKKIPFIHKKPDFGGEACVASALRSLGHNVDQDFVFDQSDVDPLLGRGCVTSELVHAAKACGLDPGRVWYESTKQEHQAAIWEMILADLKQGRPSVVVAHQQNIERFVLVIGFNSEKDEVLYHDPNHENGANQSFDRKGFLAAMQMSFGSESAPQKRQVVVLRTLGGTRVLQPSKERFTNADYAQHIRELKTKLPNEEFSIVLQKPFVVVGDGGVDRVKRTAEGTVKWAVDHIKQDYFKRDPLEILDIWLFKNPESYKKHNQMLFGEAPSTPYGYYSSHHRALVMDISTGGGTLVHEIVHPFIESNFTLCPSWFNEGLASLYEQSNSRDGHIVGLTNWRLRGLQQTIEAKRLGTFKELCETTRREFYQGAGTNYAQARYLCYYLQEQGKLVEFYHAFVGSAMEDPSGYETLKKVLNRDDMEQFQKEWEAYVLKLRF